MKGVGSGVERRRGASGLKPARGGGRRETRAGRKSKSLRNGVHHADGVVWGPVRMRTRLLHPLVRVIRGSSPLRFLCLGQLPSRHHGLQVLRPQLPHLRRAELALRVHRVLLRLDRLALLPLALPPLLLRLRVEGPREATSGRSRKASEAESKGVARGVSGSKARDPGRRDTPGDSKVLIDRRAPRRRGRMGTSVQN